MKNQRNRKVRERFWQCCLLLIPFFSGIKGPKFILCVFDIEFISSCIDRKKFGKGFLNTFGQNAF